MPKGSSPLPSPALHPRRSVRRSVPRPPAVGTATVQQALPNVSPPRAPRPRIPPPLNPPPARPRSKTPQCGACSHASKMTTGPPSITTAATGGRNSRRRRPWTGSAAERPRRCQEERSRGLRQIHRRRLEARTAPDDGGRGPDARRSSRGGVSKNESGGSGVRMRRRGREGVRRSGRDRGGVSRGRLLRPQMGPLRNGRCIVSVSVSCHPARTTTNHRGGPVANEHSPKIFI